MVETELNEEPRQYVCDDCGILDEDEVVWHGAGKCPHCGKEALEMEEHND